MKSAPRPQVLAGALAVLASLPLSVGCVQNENQRVKQSLDVARKEQTPDKLFARGKGFAAVGDLTRAEQYLVAALDSGGDEKQILPVLLAVLVDGRRYRLAIDTVENHLKKYPSDTRLRFLAGTLYMAVGENAQARARLEEVAQSKPPEPEAHYALGVLARDADRDPLRADQHFRTYLRLKPDGAHVNDARASLLKSVP